MFPKRCTLLIAGYIRKEETENKLSSNIPNPIKHIIYLFYPKRCEVYGIGSNAYHELGIGTALTAYKKLSTFSDHLFDPKHLYTGFHRFTIKTIENKIFSLGNNYNGDCGNNKYSKVAYLCEINMQNIELDENHISSCVVGNGSNTMVFCINGIMYATGINSYEQFGHLAIEYSYKKPIKINLKLPAKFSNIIQIECSSTHVLCLNDKGKMFAWGDNTLNQCGINTGQEKITEITPLKCNAVIKQIKVGSYHCLCISDRNKLYVFGKNSANNCGVADISTVKCPTLHSYFKDKEITFIHTKSHHSLCIDSQNIAYLFGDNASYQVHKKINRHLLICVFQKMNKEFEDVLIEQGSCGSAHTMLLTRRNKLIGFGSNQYRQCSPSLHMSHVTDPHLLTHDELAILAGQRILRVVAGDSTTLIIVEG